MSLVFEKDFLVKDIEGKPLKEAALEKSIKHYFSKISADFINRKIISSKEKTSKDYVVDLNIFVADIIYLTDCVRDYARHQRNRFKVYKRVKKLFKSLNKFSGGINELSVEEYKKIIDEIDFWTNFKQYAKKHKEESNDKERGRNGG